MKNDFVYYVAEISDEKFNELKNSFNYAVCVNKTVIGFANDDKGFGEDVTLVPSNEVKTTKRTSIITLYYVRDAELPTITEMFKYTIMGHNGTDEDETIIGFTDAEDFDPQTIMGYDFIGIVDNVSGKRQNYCFN